MSRAMARRLAIGLLVAAALAGAAAAGNSKEPQKRLTRADQAWARSIRVQRSDLPGTGWKAEPSDDDDSTAPPQCKNPDLSDLVATGWAEEPDFSRGGSFVGSGSAVFVNEAQARTSWARMSRPSLAGCLVLAVKEGLRSSGATLAITTNGPIPIAKPTPRFLALRVRFTLSGPAARIQGRIGYYLLNRGRADAVLMVMSFGKPLRPVSEAVERRLVARMASRLRR